MLMHISFKKIFMNNLYPEDLASVEFMFSFPGFVPDHSHQGSSRCPRLVNM
jgi:hypothetical protein